MDCHICNDVSATSIMVHLATIEEDIDEINDDDDDDPLEYTINKIMDNNDFPLRLQYKTHVQYIKNDINDDIHQINNETSIESTTTTSSNNHFSNHNTNSHSNNTTIVPFIFVTHDKISPQFEYQSSRMETSTMSSINADNISLKDYFERTSCPGSPTLPDKLLSSASTTATLSPPGIHLVASSTSITSSGKRRGLGLSGVHRASYKRAHTGRLSLDHTPYELFIELQELRQDENNEYTWHECARWIRYEEDYDVEMELWQAPRVGCLNFHSLLELRRGLQYGIVLLDLEEQKLECIYEAIINDAIANGQMNKDVKDELLRLLTSNHKHPEIRSFRRRSSTLDFPPLTTRRSSLAFRKNEQNNNDNTNTRRMSLLESKVNGDINKTLKTLIVQYDNIAESIVTDLHTKINLSDEFQANIENNSNENINQIQRPSGPQAFSLHRPSQSLSKKIREATPHKSDVMRCIPDNAECAEVLIGSMRNLSRPIMAFVRLSQGQLISNMTEVPLPVRFLFLLIGPTMDEYLEIGRALSTLFSTLDFRETAYQAMDRRDLLNGVNDFLSDSIVLPPGDFDKELLLPIIETARLKKLNAKRRSTRARSQNSDRPTDQEHRPSQVILSPISTLSHDKPDEDPFKRSGYIFGGVYREMCRRYHHYKSDFIDAFSLNCLVSLIFMFIACLAPALTFGGIIADKTSNRLGVNEMLIASSVSGLLFGLVSGQPLLILGPTGPFLVFEEMVYDTRQTLSDFGMTISLLCMVLFDILITKNAGGHSLTQKITVPNSIQPSDRERGNIWPISPLRKRLPFWVYFASSFPAILISVVLFFEVELTSIMIQSKLKCVHTTKAVKGTGYHLDILIAGVLISISGLFGLPWICAAPVRSIAHVASLSKYSKTHAPGEKPRLIDIKDQRLTNIGVHILIGCTIFAAPIIRKIPVAALFGIFLYFGIVSISGTQLFSRLKMMFIPTKYHPNVGYLRRIRQMKRYAYTFIQIGAAGLLISIKVTNFAFLFPFILVLLVPFRKWCLPFIFTDRELTELDGDEQQDSIFDDEIDFYGQVHLPI
ncbi:unnamed protein product [Rotaria sp. Silwood1]|nr:unnamed protein product [Rotaria sp. Silwood1]